MTRSSISQKRVAQISGVSQSTVSLILAGKPIGSQATRSKVLATAETLGYRPNLLVHGIQTGKTQVVGVMVPPIEYYWTEIIYGIHDALIAREHVPINIWASHHGTVRHSATAGDDALPQIHRLLDRRVDGVILWPPLASLFHEHIKEFSSRNLPVVTIDHDLPDEMKADSVGSDDAMGGRLAALHLLELGHRNFGHLAGPLGASWAQRRLAAFQETVKNAPNSKCVVMEANVKHRDAGVDEARLLLDLPDPPTAIFAASDRLAASVYKVAAERGIKIPDELSVIGFADDFFAAQMNPPLSTVRQSAYEVGQKAAELVMSRSLSSKPVGKVRRLQLPVNFVLRESTAPPGARITKS